MKTILMAVIITLTGCAQMYDRQDVCQRTELLKTGEYPSYCGGTSARYVTRDYTTGKPLTVTKATK